MEVDENPITDSSTGGHDGALKGAGEPDYATASPPKSYSVGYYTFDGTDDYVDCGLGITQSVQKSTTTCWVKVGTAPGTGDEGDTICALSDQNSRRNFWFGYRNNSGTYQLFVDWFLNGIGWNKWTFNQTLTTGTWYHLALIIDTSTNPDTITFYVNGSANAGNFDSGNNNSDRESGQTSYFYIGKQYPLVSGSTYWDGSIDELGMFTDTNLSSTEINDIMDNGLVGSEKNIGLLFCRIDSK